MKNGILIAVGFSLGLAASALAVTSHENSIGDGHAPHSISADGTCVYLGVTDAPHVAAFVEHDGSHCGSD